MGARIEPESDEDHPDGPEGLSPLASVPFLEVPDALDAVLVGSLGQNGSSMAARSTKPVSTGICRPIGVSPVVGMSGVGTRMSSSASSVSTRSVTGSLVPARVVGSTAQIPMSVFMAG